MKCSIWPQKIMKRHYERTRKTRYHKLPLSENNLFKLFIVFWEKRFCGIKGLHRLTEGCTSNLTNSIICVILNNESDVVLMFPPNWLAQM